MKPERQETVGIRLLEKGVSFLILEADGIYDCCSVIDHSSSTVRYRVGV
jgi:hypothetical protein